MKYKNRLIIPTIVSTSLLASTMVANAEEADQDGQYSGQNTEVYSVNDETAETDLDIVESDEASEEESDDKKSDDESEETESEEAVEDTEIAEEPADSEDDPEAAVAETAAQEESEEAVEEKAEVQAAEVQNAESETTTVESVDDAAVEESIPEEEVTESTEEVPVEENEIEEQVAETKEPAVEEPAEPVESEEIVGTTAMEEVVEEDAAVETEAVAEEEQEVESEASVESEAAVTSKEPETKEAENTPVETDSEEETVEPAEPAEEPAEVTKDSEDVQTEETAAAKEADNQEADQPAENEIETETESEAATAEADEPEAAEETQTAETPQSEEAPTYKYNSDSLEEELESLSSEEQAAFLEENADNIEADEKMLAELTESLALENEELNAEEVYAAASTMSTISLSQVITDINQYISDNNFDVAEIKYDYIPNLPKYAYHSNYGWEPENGEVGKPKGVVLHDVGNENSTIYGEIEYMSRNWENAFVHAFVDADNIIQVADTDYLAYGAGPVSNDMHMHVELMRYDNAHDFAKSINNYADYIANLLYKYKLPVISAEETGEGTLYSHVAVSNHLGGTASPDPYEYFARFDYEYNDVINLIGQRYNDMYNKHTTPQISMPVEQGTADLIAEVNSNNLGLYESVTDVRTKSADDLLGQQFRVVRTATYNYDDYYLLEDENGVSLGWMYAGDLTTSDYVPEAEEDENLEEQKPEDPKVPTESEEDGADDTGDEEQIEEQTPDEDNETDDQNQDEENTNDEQPIEEDSDENSNNDVVEDSGEENQNQEESVNPESPEEPVQPEDVDEGSEEIDDNTEETPEESEDNENQNEEEAADSVDENNNEETADEGLEDEANNQAEDNSNEETDDSEQESEEEETTASDENGENDESDINADEEVVSSLEDSATGVRVVSETGELEGKSIVVTMMNPSGAIGAAHDLYDIHILDENGSLYSLNNPVTVYLPENGYVSNVYYLGDIGETLEAVNYRTEDGYAVFEVDSFSQYAVVYGNSNEDNTTITPVPGDKGSAGEGNTADLANDHPTVYTEKDVNTEGEAVAADSVEAHQGGSGEVKETEMLPNTGIPEQSTTIFAAILAALGLGFLVKRRKTTEK